MNGRGLIAKRKGFCDLCSRTIARGAPLARGPVGWAHRACAEAAAETERVRQGVTYASQRPSGYRRGQSPSGNRSRLR